MLSIIIPNWNGLRGNLLPTCLWALRTQTYRDFEAIVVDNHSTDGSQWFMGNTYPEVRVLALETNRGFAPAVNEGIRAARGNVLVPLNNDTEADPNWLEELARVLDAAGPRVGMVAPWIRLIRVLDGRSADGSKIDAA